MDGAKHVVLRAKELLENMPDVSAMVNRDSFVSACTTASRRFIAEHRSYRVPLSKGESEILRQLLCEEIGKLKHRSSSRSASANGDATSTSLSKGKIRLVEFVKQLMEPYYREGNLRREVYSRIVYDTTVEFERNFPNSTKTDQLLVDAEKKWIRERVEAECLAATPVSRRTAPTEGQPVSQASAPVVDFEAQLAQTRQYVDGSLRSPSPVRSEKRIRRTEILRETCDLSRQISELQRLLAERLQQLQELEE